MKLTPIRSPHARLIWLLVGAVVFSSCQDDQTAPQVPGSILGVILVEGTPLQGALVRLAPPVAQETRTDASGRYEFAAVSAGTVQITVVVEAPDITVQDATRSVTVTEGGRVEVDFAAAFVRTAAITGSVTVAGVGLSDVELLIVGPETYSASTGEGGSYAFTEIRSGTYTVTAESSDPSIRIEEPSMTVTVGVGEESEADFLATLLVAASGRIDAIEDVQTGAWLGFSALWGDLEVLTTIDGGSRDVQAVRIDLDGEVVGEVQVSTEGGAMSWPASVRVPMNTIGLDPDTGESLIKNGPGTLTLQIVTAEDGVTVVDSEAVTIANVDVVGGLVFVTGEEGGGVVSQTRLWFGNQDLQFRVIPILYSTDLTVGWVEIQAVSDPSVNGGPGLDFGSGPGVPHMVAGPEFLFTASNEDNHGFVEDSPAGVGHRVMVTRIFDELGVDVSHRIVHTAAIERLYLDFVGPVVGAAAELWIGGAAVVPGAWYSGGVVSGGDVSEAGVGGIALTVDALVAGQTVLSGVSDVSVLGERLPEFVLEATGLSDLLGNSGSVVAIPTTALFGIDMGEVTISDVLQASGAVINPTDAAGDGIADNQLQFTLADPLLADASPGSGLATLTLTGEDGEGNPQDLTAQIAPGVEAANQVDLSGLLDGVYSLTLEVDDSALQANASEVAFDFTLDRTAPTFSIADAPPAAISIAGADAAFVIEGEILDDNGLSEATIVLRDGGANTSCEDTDVALAIGNSPGEVDRNSIAIAAPTDLSEAFRIADLGAGTQQVVCFWVETADTAVGVDGVPEPNRSATVVRTVIDWN